MTNLFPSNRNADICSAVIDFQLLPQDHSLPASRAARNSAPRRTRCDGVRLHGKWQTMTKINRESRKTFEHLLFVLPRDCVSGRGVKARKSWRGNDCRKETSVHSAGSGIKDWQLSNPWRLHLFVKCIHPALKVYMAATLQGWRVSSAATRGSGVWQDVKMSYWLRRSVGHLASQLGRAVWWKKVGTEHHNLEVISHQLDCRRLQFWFLSAIFLCLNSQTNLIIRRSKRTKWARGPLRFPALRDGEGCQKAGALPSGACLMRGGFLAAILHGHSVFNPSKSVLLWPHTCASDSKASAAYQPVLCSGTAPPAPFLLHCEFIQIKKLQIYFRWLCGEQPGNWTVYGRIWSGKILTRSHFLKHAAAVRASFNNLYNFCGGVTILTQASNINYFQIWSPSSLCRVWGFNVILLDSILILATV